jgi:hypothetical protein
MSDVRELERRYQLIQQHPFRHPDSLDLLLAS